MLLTHHAIDLDFAGFEICDRSVEAMSLSERALNLQHNERWQPASANLLTV
jgi:hypothetical protein